MPRISDGDTIQHTPGTDLAAGAVVELTSMIGIADSAIAANQLGALSVTGLYELPRISSVVSAIPAGTVLYWNISASEVRATAGGGFEIGKSVEESPKFAETIRVLLSQ